MATVLEEISETRPRRRVARLLGGVPRLPTDLLQLRHRQPTTQTYQPSRPKSTTPRRRVLNGRIFPLAISEEIVDFKVDPCALTDDISKDDLELRNTPSQPALLLTDVKQAIVALERDRSPSVKTADNPDTPFRTDKQPLN